MTFLNTLRIAGFSTLLFVCAGIAAAQGPVADTDNTTSELEMTAEVETALQLNITTGSGGSTVTPGGAGLFSVNLGSINALGAGTPASGVVFNVFSTHAIYATPINLTPVFSGFAPGSEAAITVIAGGSADDDMAYEGTASTGGTGVTETPKNVASGLASESNTQRFVGFVVSHSELAGAKTATLVYEVTVSLD